MATSLLLDQKLWDLVLDARGNIALASEPYSVAQDVASAIRTFLGEVWYDTSLGVPYFQSILGKTPPLGLIKSQLVAAAENVPLVLAAKCFLSLTKNRELKGQVQFVYRTSDAAIGKTAEAAVSFLGSSVVPVYFVGDNGALVGFEGER